MKLIKICSLLALLAIAGCAGKNSTKETDPEFFELLAVTIKTTKGDIQVVVIPASFRKEVREDHTNYFLNCADPKIATFDGAAIKPTSGPRGYKFFDCVEFYIPQLKGKAIKTIKFANIVPCRGTLYLNQTSSTMAAEAWRFIILKRNSKEKGCKQDILLPSAGRVACVGQVTKGLDILDKLTKNDKIISIRPAPTYKVSAKKYAMYGAGRIDNFADILKND